MRMLAESGRDVQLLEEDTSYDTSYDISYGVGMQLSEDDLSWVHKDKVNLSVTSASDMQTAIHWLCAKPAGSGKNGTF